MTPADLARTHAAAFHDTRPWSETEFASLLSQTGMILCGDAKSFVLGRVTLDEAEILTLATHPDFQRLGYAQIQLDAFLSMAHTQGATLIILEVAEDNIAAKKLYLNNNFTIKGHRPKYYARPDGIRIGADILRRTV